MYFGSPSVEFETQNQTLLTQMIARFAQMELIISEKVHVLFRTLAAPSKFPKNDGSIEEVVPLFNRPIYCGPLVKLRLSSFLTSKKGAVIVSSVTRAQYSGWLLQEIGTNNFLGCDSCVFRQEPPLSIVSNKEWCNVEPEWFLQHSIRHCCKISIYAHE